MLKSSRTYRLIAALTGLLILAGLGSPTGLFAAAHCSMAMNNDSVEQMQHDYDMAEHHTNDHSAENNKATTDCELGFTCDCCSSQTIIKSRSANTFNRTDADFSAVVVKILDEDHERDFIILDNRLENEATNTSPPIFLKNSTFLN